MVPAADNLGTDSIIIGNQLVVVAIPTRIICARPREIVSQIDVAETLKTIIYLLPIARHETI